MTKNPPTGKAPVAEAVATAIAGTTTTVMLRPDEIAPSPTNPRKTFPAASLEELANSLAHDGQVQPILVRPITVDTMLRWNKDHPGFDDKTGTRPRYEIVSGERRWRAATLKGIELRAEIRELTDLQVVRIQIIENLHREEVHPLEEAEGYEYLLKHSAEKVTVDQIADEVGKSRSYVHKRLKLAALCEDARVKFLAGEYDASTALLIARIPTPALQMQAIEEIDRIGGNGDDHNQPSYRQIRSHLARRFHLDLATAPFDTALTDLVAGCGACAACPKRTGNQAALFEDVDDADTCTDPDCFESKKVAGRQRIIDKARADGMDVVEGEEAKSIRPHYWGPVQGHVSVRAVAYKDDAGEEVTYQQLIDKAGKKAPKPLLFLDPHNQDTPPDFLITDRAKAELLKKFPGPKVEEPKPTNPARGFDEASSQRSAEQREREIRSRTNDAIRTALLAQADKPRTAADLVMLIFALSVDSLTDDLLEAAGVELPGDDQPDFDEEATLIDKLLAMPGDQLASIVFRMTLGSLTDYASPLPLRVLEHAAEAYGIKADKLRKLAEKAVDSEDEEQDE